tara:strand:- start:615 stop:830 length:216 start_codon:yes stop_codon:yes gene_type:complete
MWTKILEHKKKKEEGARLPLRIPLRIYDVPIEDEHNKKNENQDNNKKSNNEGIINVNKEFEVDFDINKMRL